MAQTLGYRTTLWFREETNTDALLGSVEEHFVAWVRGKGNPQFGFTREDNLDLSHGSSATRAVAEAEGGTWQLSEPRIDSAWTSTVSLGLSPAPWLHMRIEATSAGAAPSWAATPRVIRALLKEHDLWDGVVRALDQPATTLHADVGVLAAAIQDASRSLPVLVAATPYGVSAARWRQFVERFTRETVGLAHVTIADREATEALNALLGPDFSVGEGTIRTYLPRVDIHDPADARRHRYLSSSRLVGGIADPKSVERAVGWAIRGASLDGTIPIRVRELERKLRTAGERIEGLGDEQWHSQLARAAFGDDHLDEPRRRALVAIVASARASLESPFGSVSNPDVDELESKLAEAVRLSEDREVDLAERDAEVSSLRDNLTRVRLLLSGTSQAEEAWLDVPETDLTKLPSDMDELLSWIDTQCDHVLFTGDAEVVQGLEQHDTLGRWAGVAWSHVRALNSYAEHKRQASFSGSFADFLRSSPPGAVTMSARAYAPTESDTVLNNAKMRQERIFPVPESVDKSGEALFVAHTRIAAYGMVSPRLYFLDATSGLGKVIIGYIGPHLRNAGTN